nr:ABC transporter permease [Ornithinibacillus scapharcae]
MTARIASTPLLPYFYLIGKWVPNIIVVIVQIVILFMFGKLVYGVTLEQPFALIVISLVLAITVTGVGLALALLVNTNNMGIAMTQIIALGGAVLSGLWVPIDMMPSFIQDIANFLPQFWAHQAFQDAMLGAMENVQLLKESLILVSYGLVGFLIAMFRYPHFLKKARG